MKTNWSKLNVSLRIHRTVMCKNKLTLVRDVKMFGKGNIGLGATMRIRGEYNSGDNVSSVQ